MIPIDTYISVTLDRGDRQSGSVVLELRTSDNPDQTFSTLVLRDEDIIKLLRGARIRSRFQMWQGPR